MENLERKSSQQQIRPIVRNLKAPAPPRFTRENSDCGENSMPVFKINTFINQSLQKVRISHYEKGIYMFYVQLEALDSQLQALLAKIQSIKLINLKNRPTQIGAACLARYHKKIHRVAIAKIYNDNSDSFLCHFVDFGHSTNVKFENLFHIPEPFLNHPTFAVQFSFAGIQNISFKCPIQEINSYFKDITENKLLTLKCVPIDGPPNCQYCELFDNENNILNILRVYDPINFQLPQPVRLKVQQDFFVKVCYVQSVKEFYIHVQDADILFKYDMMYDDLQKLLPSCPVVHKLRQNQFVGVKIDNEWYRGRVCEISANKFAHVEIIDFGIIEEVHVNNIYLLPSKFIDIASYAYRCCLEGFEMIEVSENITTQFEMFCSDVHEDRRLFKMNINRYDPKVGYLAKLDDVSVNPPANVNRILLKNSRPLAETITLENARKRHKETQRRNKDNNHLATNKSDVITQEVTLKDKESTNRMNEKNRSNSQRGRGNQVGGRGVSRSSPSRNNSENNDIANNNRRQRTHFDKSIENTNAKTNEKQQKEHIKTTTGIKEQITSDSDLNDNESVTKKPQKYKGQKGSKNNKKSDNEHQIQPSNGNSKQKSPPKQDKFSNKQKSPVCDDSIKKPVEPVPVKHSNEKSGWVSTLLSVNEAFVHFDEHIEGLERILDELFNFYEGQKGTPLKEPKVGTINAYKSQDGNWYRCQILSVDNEFCRLRNQEYGNTECVQNVNIRALDDRFQKYGKLVEKAYFNIKPSRATFDDNQLLKEMLTAFNEGAKELNFKLIKPYKDGHIIDAIDPETNENIMESLLTKMKIAVRINENELTNILETNLKKEEEELKVIEESVSKISTSCKKDESADKKSIDNKKKTDETKNDVIHLPKKNDRISGKMTALTSPNDFYLTRVDMLQHFNKFHTDIQILAPALQPLIDFSCGTFCLAQQPFDSHWYRAKIIDSDESIITVRCIDNGKTFSIDNKLCMKNMPEQLHQKSFFGVPCSLPVKIERKFEEEATQFMLKMVEQELEYKVLLSTVHVNYIELFQENNSIADLLIEKKYAQRVEIFPSGNGYTSHINSISDFYVQLESDQLKLDLISSIMDGANGNFQKVTDPKVDQVVAAKFPDDDGWYRSKIESLEDNGYFVKFIDYGNSCFVKEIGKIDESIAELPAYAKHCCLFKPKNIVSFCEAAEEEFKKITANGETILHVKVVKAGDTTEVELFCEHTNIVDRLMPLCKLKSDKSNDITDI